MEDHRFTIASKCYHYTDSHLLMRDLVCKFSCNTTWLLYRDFQADLFKKNISQMFAMFRTSVVSRIIFEGVFFEICDKILG